MARVSVMAVVKVKKRSSMALWERFYRDVVVQLPPIAVEPLPQKTCGKRREFQECMRASHYMGRLVLAFF